MLADLADSLLGLACLVIVPTGVAFVVVEGVHRWWHRG